MDFNVLCWRDTWGCSQDAHVSERLAITAQTEVRHGDVPYLHDYTLWNKGTLEELERNIRFMVSTIDFSNYK